MNTELKCARKVLKLVTYDVILVPRSQRSTEGVMGMRNRFPRSLYSPHSFVGLR